MIITIVMSINQPGNCVRSSSKSVLRDATPSDSRGEVGATLEDYESGDRTAIKCYCTRVRQFRRIRRICHRVSPTNTKQVYSRLFSRYSEFYTSLLFPDKVLAKEANWRMFGPDKPAKRSRDAEVERVVYRIYNKMYYFAPTARDTGTWHLSCSVYVI